LWRKSPARLDAETLRDAILTASDELNRDMFGPGYVDSRTFVNNSQFYESIDAIGHSFHRRSLYRTWIRSGRNPLLDVFDCPDPSTKTPARAVTTTPLQALSLLNNSFILRMSEAAAAHARLAARGNLDRQLDAVYLATLQRAPDDSELQLVRPFVQRHGLEALVRVLVNSNEFVYVD
jgi:hypothetical protein